MYEIVLVENMATHHTTVEDRRQVFGAHGQGRHSRDHPGKQTFRLGNHYVLRRCRSDPDGEQREIHSAGHALHQDGCEPVYRLRQDRHA